MIPMFPPSELNVMHQPGQRYPLDWSDIEFVAGEPEPEDDMTTITQKPNTLDLEMYEGDAFALLFTFTDQSTQQPWELEGSWVAEIWDTTALVTSFDIDDSEQDIGRVILSLTGAQTQELFDHPEAVLKWDLQQNAPEGPKTWYRGQVHVTPDVTP